MLVAMGAKLFQLNSSRGIAPIFLSGVPGHPSGAFVGIAPAFCTFESNNESNTFSHAALSLCTRD
jgi:hypothetical protein